MLLVEDDLRRFFLLVCVCLEQTLNQKHVCQQPSRDSELKRLTGFDRSPAPLPTQPSRRPQHPRALAESKGRAATLTRRLRGRGRVRTAPGGLRGLLLCMRPPRMRGLQGHGEPLPPRHRRTDITHAQPGSRERRLASGARAGPGHGQPTERPLRLCAQPAEPAISAIRA